MNDNRDIKLNPTLVKIIWSIFVLHLYQANCSDEWVENWCDGVLAISRALTIGKKSKINVVAIFELQLCTYVCTISGLLVWQSPIDSLIELKYQAH